MQNKLIRTSVDTAEPYKYEKKTYPAKFLRDILEIHPIKGIDIGMCIALTRKDVSINFSPIKFSCDFDVCVCLFYSLN